MDASEIFFSGSKPNLISSKVNRRLARAFKVKPPITLWDQVVKFYNAFILPNKFGFLVLSFMLIFLVIKYITKKYRTTSNTKTDDNYDDIDDIDDIDDDADADTDIDDCKYNIDTDDANGTDDAKYGGNSGNNIAAHDDVYNDNGVDNNAEVDTGMYVDDDDIDDLPQSPKKHLPDLPPPKYTHPHSHDYNDNGDETILTSLTASPDTDDDNVLTDDFLKDQYIKEQEKMARKKEKFNQMTRRLVEGKK